MHQKSSVLPWRKYTRQQKKIVMFFIVATNFIYLHTAYAQSKFQQYLPKLPGTGPNRDPAQINDIGGLIAYLFNFGLWVVGLVIFIQFARAGIEWIFAGPNITQASTAKARMQNTVTGFLLLLAAYMILHIINPDLVEQTFQIQPVPRHEP